MALHGPRRPTSACTSLQFKSPLWSIVTKYSRLWFSCLLHNNMHVLRCVSSTPDTRKRCRTSCVNLEAQIPRVS